MLHAPYSLFILGFLRTARATRAQPHPVRLRYRTSATRPAYRESEQPFDKPRVQGPVAPRGLDENHSANSGDCESESKTVPTVSGEEGELGRWGTNSHTSTSYYRSIRCEKPRLAGRLGGGGASQRAAPYNYKSYKSR